jgi:hypothetical protein
MSKLAQVVISLELLYENSHRAAVAANIVPLPSTGRPVLSMRNMINDYLISMLVLIIDASRALFVL